MPRIITISKKITLLGSGADEAGTILTGTVSVAADGVTLDGIWFQQTYSEEDSKDPGCLQIKNHGNGNKSYHPKLHCSADDRHCNSLWRHCSLRRRRRNPDSENTELIAPVAGTADEINSASPSVIGVAAWAQTGENIDEAWKLVVTGLYHPYQRICGV